MVEAGDWTTTKLVNLILGIVLLILIVVGSITGIFDPLLKQIGTKYDEWILKTEKGEDRISETFENFEVNPDGTCKLFNYGENKNNYTFDHYTQEIYQNGENVSPKIINYDLDSLREERELYYATIEKLIEENILQDLGKESGFFEITNGQFKIEDYKETYNLYWENGVGSLLIGGKVSEDKLSFGELRDKLLNGQVPNKDKIFFKYWNDGQDFLEGKQSETLIMVSEKTDVDSALLSIWEHISQQQESAFPLGYNLDNIEAWIKATGNGITFLEEVYNSDYLFTSDNDYPLIEFTNLKTKEIRGIQFTSNYLYFNDLICNKGYDSEELNKYNYLFMKYDPNSETFRELYKEYILTDDAFEEMIEINKAYQYMTKNCI